MMDNSSRKRRMNKRHSRGELHRLLSGKSERILTVSLLAYFLVVQPIFLFYFFFWSHHSTTRSYLSFNFFSDALMSSGKRRRAAAAAAARALARQKRKKASRPPPKPLPKVIDSELVYRACPNKRRLLDVLLSAQNGVFREGDQVRCHDLPTWEAVTAQYRSEPVIHGLETCDQYRQLIDERNWPPAPRPVGMYNTGTNALAVTMLSNLVAPLPPIILPNGKRVVRFNPFLEPPWGKHVLAKYRGNTTLPRMRPIPKESILPVVMVRDPYRWQMSMCKESYEATWMRTAGHCPLLVPTEQDLREGGSPTVYACPLSTNYTLGDHFPSLPHYWSEWYRQYLHADFPRLIVRYEDTIFHAEKVLKAVAQCAGIRPNERFVFVGREAKGHGASGDLFSAMVKSGNGSGRYNGMTADDIAFARQHYDPAIMELFRYRQPPDNYHAPEHPDPIRQPAHAFVRERQRPCPHYNEFIVPATTVPMTAAARGGTNLTLPALATENDSTTLAVSRQ
jgi:hypothetical protein